MQQKEEIQAQRDAIVEQKNEIEKQRDIAEKQRDQISVQKQKITDSIEYASKIQAAVLPPSQLVHKVIPNAFIMLRPRDIVSGDFYWVRKVNNQAVVAAVDCTGHGVPGAFMSMLGTSLLNEIVDKGSFTDAGDILNQLRESVKNALHQNQEYGESTSDGMDCALCIIDFDKRKMQFAGANNPLYIFRNQQLIEYAGDRMPIGIHLLVEEQFKNHTIDLEPDDMLYIFSDGYYDQFGGDKGRKMYSRNFKQNLFEIHTYPVQEQGSLLETIFDTWKGNQRQIDDVLVMGIRI
jgi:serine phosphatase RsbU (regulator of sigma subunit)